jgi:tetratricopeptide (TPR) repeat protein
MATPSKDIFIAYSENEREVALKFREVLVAQFGDEVWMRDFDLDAGDLIFDVLNEAVTNAKWLIILISREAVKSQWLRYEANYGTLRSLQQDDDFKIIVVRLEDCSYPKHLEIAFDNLYIVDLSNEDDVIDGFIDITEYIKKTQNISSQQVIYEGRGADSDKLSLISKRNKFIFIVGWRGIGKTTFVENSIKSLLKKTSISVSLTSGHSHDLLSRQIIQKLRIQQPIHQGNISDSEFIGIAVDALKTHSNRFFLFLDDVQNGLDNSNRLLPYLADFLIACQDADLKTHVILATTRNPDFPEDVTKSTDMYRLGVLNNEYTEEIIYQWLENSENLRALHLSAEMPQLLKVIGGHPLAAKRMALYLRNKTPEQLLVIARRERFQLGFAEYILRSTQNELSDIHRLILQILAIIREPVTQTDIMQIKALSVNYSLEEIHEARWELLDWFLIEQTGELMSLHGFLRTYFRNQLRNKDQLRHEIALDYGDYAYKKALDLDAELTEKINIIGEQTKIDLSNAIFRYAIAADRLLRVVGKDELADKLPIRVKGVLRGMVYYFYQELEDYSKALNYAEKWLEINPNDSDIRLYQIRCYRKLGSNENLNEARRIIARMEQEDHRLQFKVRLVREKALIAQREGDYELSKSYFREAIKIDSRTVPYSDVYVGLARLLIREADNLPDWSIEKQEIADESIELLEVAKREPDNFYRFHLDIYVEALIEAGQEGKAFPLLLEALDYRPDDGKLNFRMAEIRRERKEFEEALHYVEIAQKQGFAASILTHANIFYDQAVLQMEKGKRNDAIELLNKALEKVSIYKRQYSDRESSNFGIEVADTIQSKIYRLKGDLDAALQAIKPYLKSSDPYTIYEQSLLYSLKSDKAAAQSRYADALAHIRDAIEHISRYKYKLPPQLKDLLDTASDKEVQFKSILGI